jgi:hypothetical protein
MSEGSIDVVLDPDVTKEGDSAIPRAATATANATAEDRLPVSRLPPIAPPPLRPPSVPPGVLPPPGVVSSRNTPTVPPQGGRDVGRVPPEAAPRYPSEEAPPPKPSWFRALLTTTSPPPAPAEYDPHSLRRTIAVGCVAAACVFAVIALMFAFRAPPSLGTMQPVVAATVVLAHALLAIGAGALTYGLLRIGERLLSERAGSGESGGPGGFPG